MRLRKTLKRTKITDILIKFVVCAFMMTVVFSVEAFANDNIVNVDINGTENSALEIVILLTVLSLLPSIVIMTTSFARIVIVLSFTRNALGLQQTPPNQVLIGLAIFLTLFIMAPVIEQINVEAYQPYKNEEITQDEFYAKASEPVKEFMLKQTGKKELDLFISLAHNEKLTESTDVKDLPLTVVIPAFMTSELRRAFIIGFLIFIPFLVIDTIVSTVLMSMGMMMLPPVMISLPFKVLLFILVDGWSLLFKTLVMSFNI